MISAKIGDDSKKDYYINVRAKYHMSETGENNIDEYEDEFEEDLDIDENEVEELDDQ